MPRVASTYSKNRTLLMDALDYLKRFADFPEAKEIPNYEKRIEHTVAAARNAFSACLDEVLPKKADKKGA